MGASVDPKTQVLKARAREPEKKGCFGKILAFIFLMAMAGGGGYWYLMGMGNPLDLVSEKVLSKVETVKGSEVTIYFADPQWTRLIPEKAAMANEPDKGKKIARLVELLARGPSGDAGPVLPKGAKARQVYLGRDGVAIIDLDAGFEELRGQGVAAELLTVFAIVHTVTENVEGISSVRLIAGGQEVETLAGNVSINEPLRPRPDLVGVAR